jgi:2-dehydropantoate 2-reductase
MRFAVVGAGGVGGYFGAKLAAAGAAVTFVARGAHLAAIHERGLEVQGPHGNLVVRPAAATDDTASVGGCDVVLVAVKAWQLGELLPRLKPMVGPNTSVVPLLNGVEAPGQLASALGDASVLGGLCYVMSYVVGPGVIRHLGAAASVTIGELSGGKSERAEAIRAEMARAAIDTTVSEDVTAAMWKKLAFIASLGGLNGVTQAPAGVLRGNASTRALLEQAVGEVVAVARARGVALAPDDVSRAMALVDSLPPDGFGSMPRDLFARKRSELDALSGAVVRMGRDAGVATPLHDFVYRSLLPLELRARGEVTF